MLRATSQQGRGRRRPRRRGEVCIPERKPAHIAAIDVALGGAEPKLVRSPVEQHGRALEHHRQECEIAVPIDDRVGNIAVIKLAIVRGRHDERLAVRSIEELSRALKDLANSVLIALDDTFDPSGEFRRFRAQELVAPAIDVVVRLLPGFDRREQQARSFLPIVPPQQRRGLHRKRALGLSTVTTTPRWREGRVNTTGQKPRGRGVMRIPGARTRRLERSPHASITTRMNPCVDQHPGHDARVLRVLEPPGLVDEQLPGHRRHPSPSTKVTPMPGYVLGHAAIAATIR